jgi:arylsulfatase A-like enzyme
MRRDDLEHMPHVRHLLVEEGATFSAFFVNVSLCCPSRATLLRGQYSHNTGVLSNERQGGGFDKAFRTGIEKATVATALQAAGYVTGYFGKYLNGYPGVAGSFYVPPGWSTWSVPVAGNAARGFGYTLLEPLEAPYQDFRIPRLYGSVAADYATDVFFGKAREFIDAAASTRTPFFAFVAPFAPHLPATPAPRHADLLPDLRLSRGPSFAEADVSDKPRFINRLRPLRPGVAERLEQIHRRRVLSLQAVDEGVASLVTRLEELGQLESTYIVFTSDNGFHLGEHRMGWGKQSAYEEDIGVPLVIRGPGVPEGLTVDQLTVNTDLAPTVAEIAGTDLAYDPDGRSLLPLLSGGATPDTWRQAVLLDLWRRASRDDRDGKTVIPPFHGVRTLRHLYVEYSTGERELYDLALDPHELDNSIGSAAPTLVEHLADRIRMLHGCRGQSCRDAEDAPVLSELPAH